MWWVRRVRCARHDIKVAIMVHESPFAVDAKIYSVSTMKSTRKTTVHEWKAKRSRTMAPKRWSPQRRQLTKQSPQGRGMARQERRQAHYPMAGACLATCTNRACFNVSGKPAVMSVLDSSAPSEWRENTPWIASFQVIRRWPQSEHPSPNTAHMNLRDI